MVTQKNVLNIAIFTSVAPVFLHKCILRPEVCCVVSHLLCSFGPQFNH